MFTLFGPSKFDRLLDILREDRAAVAAAQAQTTALMVTLVQGVQTQAELAKQHLALLTAPQEAPRVRLMTKADEAKFEHARALEGVKTAQMLPTDALIRDLEAHFATESYQ